MGGGVNIYEVYLRVEKIFHECSKRMKSFFPQDDKLHTSVCSSQQVIFFLLDKYMKITPILQCPKQRNDISDIFTSEDMENISLLSRM